MAKVRCAGWMANPLTYEYESRCAGLPSCFDHRKIYRTEVFVQLLKPKPSPQYAQNAICCRLPALTDDAARSRQLTSLPLQSIPLPNHRSSGSSKWLIHTSELCQLRENGIHRNEGRHFRKDFYDFACVFVASKQRLKIIDTERGTVLAQRSNQQTFYRNQLNSGLDWRQFHFPMQKLPKIRPSKSLEVNSPVISPRAFCA